MNKTIVLARDACRRCHQPIDLREALSGDALLWIGTDADGFRTVSCMADAPDCERCGGTGDDPADPEWACETCDGDGVVSTSDHVPTHYVGPAEAVA